MLIMPMHSRYNSKRKSSVKDKEANNQTTTTSVRQLPVVVRQIRHAYQILLERRIAPLRVYHLLASAGPTETQALQLGFDSHMLSLTLMTQTHPLLLMSKPRAAHVIHLPNGETDIATSPSMRTGHILQDTLQIAIQTGPLQTDIARIETVTKTAS